MTIPKTTHNYFKSGTKWFKVGLVIAVVSPFAGLIYGIALSLESERGKEGRIIMITSVVVAVVTLMMISMQS